MAIGLLVCRKFNDEHTWLSMLKSFLTAGGLRRALSVQHKDLKAQCSPPVTWFYFAKMLHSWSYQIKIVSQSYCVHQYFWLIHLSQTFSPGQYYTEVWAYPVNIEHKVRIRPWTEHQSCARFHPITKWKVNTHVIMKVLLLEHLLCHGTDPPVLSLSWSRMCRGGYFHLARVPCERVWTTPKTRKQVLQEGKRECCRCN